MPPASLSDFPAQLLIQVYKSLDNVKDVTALNLASHQFYDLWHSHTVSISDAVFSRKIKSFDDARELANIQQKSFGWDHCDDNGPHDPYRQTLERNKLMVSNIHDSFKYYDKESVSGRSFGALLSKAYYCVCTLVLTTEDSFAQSSCLASLDLETLQLMREFVGQSLFTLTLCAQTDGSSVPFHSRFALERLDGKSPKDTLENVLDTLKKHISALEMAEEVGNGVENV